MEHPPDAPSAPLLTRRVFLSSTYVDLKDHRAAVRETLGRMEQFPVVMENFGAHGTGDATSVSLDNLRTAQVYVGIYAWRYGYVPPGEKLSVTHQEYCAATSLPRYIFLADATSDVDQGPGALFPAGVRDPEHRDALLAFRQEVGVQVVDFFTTPDDLARKVATALHRYLVNEYWQAFLAGAGRRAPRLLPPLADGFVGRGDERAALSRRLRQGESVGVAAAVSGMGGVGKSALAAEVTRDLAAARDAFPAGIAWVRCDGRAGLDGLTWIYDQILDAWDAALPPEQLATAPEGEPAAALREHALRRVFRSPAPEVAEPGATLLLLDNVELELPLSRLLDTLPPLGVTLLLTMRHQPPGNLPLSLLPLDVLEPTPAAELFAERYRARGASWDAARDRAATEESVELLGRLPLAIELAAARCARAGGGVAALAAELREADRLGRLREPLDPQRSVRYVLSQSLAGLTPSQRVRFAALGLPAGPDWPRDVITALLAAVPPSSLNAPDTPNAAPVEDDLDTFTALSLIALAGTPAAADITTPAQPRLRMHPLLRDLANEEWRKLPEDVQDAGAAALIDAMLPFLERHKHDFTALAREEELISGAFHSAAERHIAQRQITQATEALGDYVNIGGHWRFGMDLYQSYLAIVREVGYRAGEGFALNNLGHLTDGLGLKQEAQRYFEQALAIQREFGDRRMEGIILNNLGRLAASLGEQEEAQRYFEQALDILRAVGDRQVEGVILNNLGHVADTLGEQEDALAYYEQALGIARELGDRRAEGVILNNLGILTNSLDDKEDALAYYEQALLIRREVGDRPGEGTTLNNLGRLTYELGHSDEARRCYEQALGIAREVGNRPGEGVILDNLGDLASSLGQRQEARRYYEQALEIFRAVGAVDNARTTEENIRALDNVSDAPVPAGKPRRRWPWRR